MSSCIILHVEDDPNDAFFVQLAFERAGLASSLRRVADGQEALDYLEGRGQFSDRAQWPLPQLILLDLKMPVLDGFDVLAFVRSHPNFKDLPVLILTSSDAEEDRRRAERQGATDYLVKTPTWRNVLERIRAALPGQFPSALPSRARTGELGTSDGT